MLDYVLDNLEKDKTYYKNASIYYEIPITHNIYINFFK